MAAQFPTALVTTTQLPTNRTDATVQAANHIADHTQLAQEVIAIEGELGIDPSGTYATVKARLDAIQNQTNVYTVANGSTDRAIDVNTTTIGELLNVVATLIADLQARHIIG